MDMRRAGRRERLPEADTSGIGRRAVGALMGGVGALLAAASAALAWYGDSAPHELPLRHLVQTGQVAEAATLWSSMAAPLMAAGALGLAGAAARSRVVLGLAWMAVSAMLALWGATRAIGDLAGRAPDSAEIRHGFWTCAVAAAVIVVGIAVMGPRREEIEAPLSMFDADPTD